MEIVRGRYWLGRHGTRSNSKSTRDPTRRSAQVEANCTPTASAGRRGAASANSAVGTSGRRNLNIHYDGKDARWQSFNARHGNRFRFVYTPKHASWMNQVEIWFSILQRRILKHGDFATPQIQAKRVSGFIRHWNRHECHPFRWTWRTDNLHKLAA